MYIGSVSGSMNARAMGIPKLPRYTEEEREGMYERQKERNIKR